MALWRCLPAYHPDTASSTESCLFSVREGGGLIIQFNYLFDAPRLHSSTERRWRNNACVAAEEISGCERGREGEMALSFSFRHAIPPTPSAGKDAQSDKEGKERRGPSSFAVLALLPRYVFIHCRSPFCFRIAVYDLGRSNQGSATCCRRRRVLERGCSVPPPMSDELVHKCPSNKRSGQCHRG